MSNILFTTSKINNMELKNRMIMSCEEVVAQESSVVASLRFEQVQSTYCCGTQDMKEATAAFLEIGIVEGIVTEQIGCIVQ